MSQTISLRVRIEQGIPKLLVKINPLEAAEFSAKNLGEVTLRKRAAQRGHLAVLHMSHAVGEGQLLMSVKLAELLGLEEDEHVEISAGAVSEKGSGTPKGSSQKLPAGRATESRDYLLRRSFMMGNQPAPSAAPKESHPEPRCEAGPLPAASRRSRPSAPSESIRSSMRTAAGRVAAEDAAGVASEPPPLRVAPGMEGAADQEAGLRSGSKEGQQPPRRRQTVEFVSEAEVAASTWDLGAGGTASSSRQAARRSTEPHVGQASPNQDGRPRHGDARRSERARTGGVAPQEPGAPPVADDRWRGAVLADSLGSGPGSPTTAWAAAPPIGSRGYGAPAAGAGPLPGAAEETETPAVSGTRPGFRPGPAASRQEASANAPLFSSGIGAGANGAPPTVPRQGLQASVRVAAPPKPKEGGLPPRRSNFMMQIVPFRGDAGKERSKSSSRARSTSRRAPGSKRRSSAFGTLQQVARNMSSVAEERLPIPGHWQPPTDTGGGYERSELGNEISVEVRRWLVGETSGLQCSQVVLDRALTVLSNFKLASGCQLEVLGGPLGAIIGGYSDADWLHDEVFKKQPTEAIQEAFNLLGIKARTEGDWSHLVAEEVSLVYRRLCLRGHPSRGGDPRKYLKLQVAMELVRAFAGEVGALTSSGPASEGFVLNDQALARELLLSPKEAEDEAIQLSREKLEEMNRALDEYILRQMCFKSEIIDEIARLHENCAYALLGVSSDATDEEIKRAYRLVARECHPDKGGDKEEFQELNAAFERIMEQRKTMSGGRWSRSKGGGDEEDGEEAEANGDDKATQKPKSKEKRTSRKDKQKGQDEKEEAPDAEGEEEEEEEETQNLDEEADEEDDEDDDDGEEGSNAQLVAKAGKAAEEASRYAKTAAEFAHQAADAAETARKGREQGSGDTLTKSVAHSAIVLTLTVVKAVRVVGYATLDVAAQCRAAARRNPDAVECSERSVEAMSLGLEALNAALACAEVTETTAAELQGTGVVAPGAPEDQQSASSPSERFVGAAVRASLAAGRASNAAMSAAIAAVEGSRLVMEAIGEESEEKNRARNKGEDAEEDPSNKAGGDAEKTDKPVEEADAHEPDSPSQPKQMTLEEVAAAATKRLVSQRHNNHKVLQRLNAEILSHQQNVREFLQENRQLIPEISEESQHRVMRLLRDYAGEARAELEGPFRNASCGGARNKEALLSALKELQILVPFLQPQQLAISISVKARVLKMAAMYDLQHAVNIVEQEIFEPSRAALYQDQKARTRVDEISAKVKMELSCHVAEDTQEG